MKREEAMELASNGFDELSQALAQGKSDTLVAFLNAMARFLNYSFRNCLMIVMQRPCATRVALSKTMDKSFVSPILFDIKRSEVDGPILQFQSTVFEKSDVKKLIKTLNKACDNDGLQGDRLDKAFDVWYPTLETELGKLKTDPDAGDNDVGTPRPEELLEEILDLSRINQKLLRNPEPAGTEKIRKLLQELIERTDRGEQRLSRRRGRELNLMMFEEILPGGVIKDNKFVGLQMVFSLLRKDFPWIYDMGIETINILRSRRSKEEKRMAVQTFQNVVDWSFDHPMMRELHGGSKRMYMFARELQHVLRHTLERTIDG